MRGNSVLLRKAYQVSNYGEVVMSDQVIPQSSFGQRLGLDYERWTLDCVVKIGYAVALDFSDRPELYQQVADDTADKLADLQARADSVHV